MSEWDFHRLPSVTSPARFFFEMDHQELLRHVVTRWLSRLPAVGCIRHSWPPPRSSFLSGGGERRGALCEGGQFHERKLRWVHIFKRNEERVCLLQKKSRGRSPTLRPPGDPYTLPKGIRAIQEFFRNKTSKLFTRTCQHKTH